MSRTIIVDIRNSSFPEARVQPGSYVVWRNLDPFPHSVETLGSDPVYFNAGAMLPGETSSPILFATPGKYDYICRFHTGMMGSVVVGSSIHDQEGGHDHGHGLHHYHGFVTGGRSGDRIYMTHTPVLADTRHNYQVILRSRFMEPKHARIYEELRNSEYHDQVVQIFHDHVSMPDIGSGQIKLLPNASVSYWPGGSQTTSGPAQVPVTGLEDVPVALEEVIHFHQFNTDADYPDALSYIMYGDDQDIFIDHLMNRAPSFHSVAKLAAVPQGWGGSAAKFKVPGRLMRDLNPRLITRMAIVDNAFHLFWLLPPGALIRQAQDPLIRRDNTNGAHHTHPVEFEGGRSSEIHIARFLHFDIRLLNYGVLIV